MDGPAWAFGCPYFLNRFLLQKFLITVQSYIILFISESEYLENVPEKLGGALVLKVNKLTECLGKSICL